MKKTFRFAALALAAVALTAGMSACGDDDDNNNPEDFRTIDTALVGSWTYNETDRDKTETQTITFNGDGSFAEQETEVYNNGNVVTSWDAGKWSVNARKDRVHFVVTSSSDPSDVGDEDYDNYRVSNGILYMDGNEYSLITNPER